MRSISEVNDVSNKREFFLLCCRTSYWKELEFELENEIVFISGFWVQIVVLHALLLEFFQKYVFPPPIIFIFLTERQFSVIWNKTGII